MPVRIFVAFDTDHDKDLCDSMVAGAKGQRTYEISGRSFNETAADTWEQKTQNAIESTDQVVIVCGEHTDESQHVAAEFRLAQDAGKPIILLWARREVMCKKPTGATPSESMYSWTPDVLRDQLLANQRKATPARVPERLKRQSHVEEEPSA